MSTEEEKAVHSEAPHHILGAADGQPPTTSISQETLAAVGVETDPSSGEQEKTPSKMNGSLRRVLIFVSLQMALFLCALDSTIISTSLAHIGSDFNQMDSASWVVTAYVLTLYSFQPLFSKFSDIFGRKPVLMFGIALFIIGSLLCGVSRSMIMLIVFRAVAGMGAAAIFSMVYVIISELVPPEKRGNYQGIINAVFAMSSICGPLVGGTFTDYVSWRWNFYINLPIGAVALLNLVLFLHMPIPKERFAEKLKRIDYAGSLCVFSFAVLFLLAMNFGGQLFPWKSTAVIIPLVVSGLLVVALVFVESRFAKEPLLPPRIFKNRSAVFALAANTFFGMAFIVPLLFIPLYLQIVLGDTAMWSGVRLIPEQMVISVTCTVVGFTQTKTDCYRPFLLVGMSILTIGMGLYSLFDINTDLASIYGFTVFNGFGGGCMVGSIFLALQSSVAKEDIAVITGLGNFTRLLGAALGIAIGSAIQNSMLHEELPLVMPQEYADKIIQSAQYIRNGLPQEYFDPALRVYSRSFQLVWYVMIPMAGTGLICLLFLKRLSMRSQPPVKLTEKSPIEGQTSSDEHVVVDIASTSNHEDTTKEVSSHP